MYYCAKNKANELEMMKWDFIRLAYIYVALSGFSLLHLKGQKRAYMVRHEKTIEIKPLDQLNSAFEEKNLSLTNNSSHLYFRSQRGGQIWTNTYQNEDGELVNDGDIWVAKKLSGEWLAPEVLPYGVNSSGSEDEPFVLKNGRVIYFQSWNFFWETTQGPYYRIKRKGKKWKKANGLGGGITDFFRDFSQTDGMTLSTEEKVFIVVAAEAAQENLDMYMSRKNTFGWNKPQRLALSTEGEERSVFLAHDGKSLYFASNGYEGLGGFDIYKTTLYQDGTTGQVINIGPPINTSGDDYGFIISKDGNEAYFIREGDIYRAWLENANPIIKPLQ